MGLFTSINGKDFLLYFWFYMAFVIFILWAFLKKKQDNSGLIGDITKEDYTYLRYFDNKLDNPLYKYWIYRLICDNYLLITDEKKGLFKSNLDMNEKLNRLNNIELKYTVFIKKKTTL